MLKGLASLVIFAAAAYGIYKVSKLAGITFPWEKAPPAGVGGKGGSTGAGGAK